MRSEPPPSLPCASGTMPAATAAALPPDEPPGVRVVSHGLRVGPKRRPSVTGRIPYSGIVVVPTTTAPAARSRRTTLWSCVGARVARQRRAARQAQAGDRAVAFTATGTPASGRRSPGAIGRRGGARAVGVDVDERAEGGSSASIRASASSMSSAARTSPARTSAGELGRRARQQMLVGHARTLRAAIDSAGWRGQAPDRGPRYRWVVLAVGAFGAAAFTGLRMGFPALGPELRDVFGLSLGRDRPGHRRAVGRASWSRRSPGGCSRTASASGRCMAGGLFATSLALVAMAFSTASPGCSSG